MEFEHFTGVKMKNYSFQRNNLQLTPHGGPCTLHMSITSTIVLTEMRGHSN